MNWPLIFALSYNTPVYLFLLIYALAQRGRWGARQCRSVRRMPGWRVSRRSNEKLQQTLGRPLRLRSVTLRMSASVLAFVCGVPQSLWIFSSEGISVGRILGVDSQLGTGVCQR